MSVGEAVQSHPNATVAFVATGPITLVAWGLSQVVTNIPNEVVAAAAGLSISTLLLFGRYLRMAGAAVNREGLIPCLRRLLLGPKRG